MIPDPDTVGARIVHAQNGAYYYGDAYVAHYKTPRNATEYDLECCTREKLLSTKKALDKQHIPINYIQLDVIAPHQTALFPQRYDIFLT